jgi:hypothetical protein
MRLHFSYPDSIRTGTGTKARRRFLRCIPSQVCFESLTRTRTSTYTQAVVLPLVAAFRGRRRRPGRAGLLLVRAPQLSLSLSATGSEGSALPVPALYSKPSAFKLTFKLNL